MTNEEIVKALRCCAFNGEDSCKHCTECPATGDDCESELQFAAADLIENQQNHIRALLQANDALRERQRWVPVTERLPEKQQRVIVRCEAIGTTVGWIMFGRWVTDLGPGCGECHPLDAPAASAGGGLNHGCC